jgi:ATP-dependent protease HslVU (ClpYQ) ATPase subunit
MVGVEVRIDNQYVISKLADIVKDRDLSRYIL